MKKIEDKKRELSHYTLRPEQLVDPMLKSGSTSDAFVKAAVQAINDLAAYALKLKAAITRANKNTTLTVNGAVMTIEDAVVWKREVAPLLVDLYGGMLTQARNARAQAYKPNAEAPKWVVNFDEQEAMTKLEELKAALGRLDMDLSLLNATTLVEI